MSRIRTATIIAALTLLALPASGHAASLGCADDATGVEDLAWTQAILDATNAHRRDLGLVDLQTDSMLERAAVWKARDLARRDYFSHDDPAKGDAPARDPWQRLDDCGYQADGATKAENIAAGQNSGAAFVTAWINSPGHRANIENAAMRYIGIATANADSSTYGTYSVQIFSSKPSATRSLAGVTTPEPATKTRTMLRRTSSTITAVHGCQAEFAVDGTCWRVTLRTRLQRTSGTPITGKRVAFQRVTSRGARALIGTAVTNSSGVATIIRMIRPPAPATTSEAVAAWLERGYRSARHSFAGTPSLAATAIVSTIRMPQ